MKDKKFRQYVILVIVGVLMLVAGLIIPRFMHGMRGFYTIYTSIVGSGLIVVGTVLIVLHKRKQQNVAEDGEKNSSASSANTEHKELVIPPLKDDFELYTEKDGKNLHELFSKGESVSTVTLVCPDEKLHTYDYLWYKHYGECAFCVLGIEEADEDGEPQYYKALFRVVESDGQTGLVLEEDDSVCEIVKSDFEKAVEEYSKSQTGQSNQKSGSISISYEDKGRVKCFIALSSVYLAVLIAGLVGFFTGFGISDIQSAAICKAICLSYVVVTPSYVIYLSSCNPFNFNGAVCKAIKWVAVAVMIVLAILNITALPDGIDYDGWFWGFFMHIFIPAVPFVAIFCYYAVYCWWCNDAPSKIFLIFGIAVTILFPVATALLIAYFIIVTLIAAIKWILSSIGIMAADTNLGKGFITGWTGKSFEKTYTIRDENGYEHTVKSSDGIHFYGDGQNYISDDGGNTLRKD